MPGTGPHFIPIEDFQDPRLADYADLKDKQLAALSENGDLSRPDASGLFMAEGELVVRQLVISGLRTKSVLITHTRLLTMSDSLSRLPEDVPVYIVDQVAMTRIVGFHIHRGVLAAGFRPPARSLHEVIAGARTLVVLEDLANHDNIGGVFRTVAALGGLETAAVLLSPRCCDPLYRKAIRVSMGTALRIPFANVEPWPSGLDSLRESGFRIVALSPDPNAIPVERMPKTDRNALLLGSEGPGLTPEALSRADTIARIPMAPGVDSLNVVVAAGIALHAVAPAFSA
jgi:tRNA G18 (ribose-2'-O)-methylase SpoU